ncbi:hypothetical protein [Streptomyces botrytidirepellens]|uniref:Uncharacterized protein n=1 Tax=Streptomyces botrytidirepellens TaxID=2486417 RepID=A0A3M8UE96_9ACTN|nr:hypothetical protein [Streptomyces botrytidirepellens]RNG02455.1 hypothetical protein EEJ42_35075 [Streptomyces botrytidirepellens]
MTEASIPPQPAADGGVPAAPDPDLNALNALNAPDDPHDPDDLVIEELTDASWPAVAPRICICTFGGE